MESISLYNGDYSASGIAIMNKREMFYLFEASWFFWLDMALYNSSPTKTRISTSGKPLVHSVLRHTDKKHRDSVLRGEIRRQIGRRVVKPRRWRRSLLNLAYAPLFLSLFTIFVSCVAVCQSRILFRRKIHLIRKSVLIYLVARKRITRSWPRRFLFFLLERPHLIGSPTFRGIVRCPKKSPAS